MFWFFVHLSLELRGSVTTNNVYYRVKLDFFEDAILSVLVSKINGSKKFKLNFGPADLCNYNVVAQYKSQRVSELSFGLYFALSRHFYHKYILVQQINKLPLGIPWVLFGIETGAKSNHSRLMAQLCTMDTYTKSLVSTESTHEADFLDVSTTLIKSLQLVHPFCDVSKTVFSITSQTHFPGISIPIKCQLFGSELPLSKSGRDVKSYVAQYTGFWSSRELKPDWSKKVIIIFATLIYLLAFFFKS